MNVGMSTPDPRVSLADNAVVVRMNHAFGHGDRIGNLLMSRAGSGNHYLATAVDGQYTMFDERLALSGFYARSATDGAGAGGMANVNLTWASQDFHAGVRYVDVATTFDPQLGYVPETGIVSTNFFASYTPSSRTIWFASCSSIRPSSARPTATTRASTIATTSAARRS